MERVIKIFLLTFLWSHCFLGNVFSQNYYVDSILGVDGNDGTSIEFPWKTFKNVNAHKYYSGDRILLKRGAVWEDNISISSASGTESDPIIIGAYGTGENPLIKCSTAFSNWELWIDDSNLKIWKGEIPDVKTSLGAMKNNILINKYVPYKIEGDELSAPDDLRTMKNNHFFSPLNSYIFYMRDDAGKPSNIEIGSRPYAIKIISSKFLIIDSIDCYGIGGANSSSGTSGLEQISISGSDHIIIKNLKLSYHHSAGAIVEGGSTNCILEDITSFKHGSTGLYFSSAGSGNEAIRCEVYDCGYSPMLFGDHGLIGIWNTPGVKIDSCFVRNNGSSQDVKLDAAISFVQSPNGSVVNSYVKDAAGIGIMFAENANNGLVAYSIIDHWAVHGTTLTKQSDFGGIRIGAGNLTLAQTDCKIYNNLFINGGGTTRRWAALMISNCVNKGTKVKNNIFYNNINGYEVWADSKDGFENWEFSNNLYFRTNGNVISWNNIDYGYKNIIGYEKGYFSFDQKQGQNSIVSDPMLTSDKRNLLQNSPCIGKGINLGFKSDFNGNAILEDATVDIGPFEFKKYSAPQPPKGIRIE
ncbi:MAG: right-handed parallel beta-helix repeat-containing protein [Bacilli bacterium]